MSSAMWLWLSFIALTLAGLAAVGMHLLREFSRSQLRELLRERDLLPRFEEIASLHQRSALGMESLCVVAVAAAVFTATLSVWQSMTFDVSWSHALTLTIVYVVAAIVLLWLAVIWLPLAVARNWADPLLARTWPVWRALGKLGIVSIVGAQLVERALHLVSGKRPQAPTEEDLEEEIREVVTEGQREGLLEEDAREMIESVMALGEAKVSEIMTPRTDVISLPVDMPWEEALTVVISSGHTRFPVYGKSPDEVVGILHIKEMLHQLVPGARQTHRLISEIMRPPLFVPETKPVDDMLQKFQHSRNHIAVVVDEYGGVSGVVTIEDVLEEIVGEIADEHDEAATSGIKPTGDHSCEALGHVHVSEINQQMGLRLPEDEHFDTIGGFVFHEFGRIPHAGEELSRDGLHIRVLEATRRRVIRVAIEVVPTAAETEATNAETEARNAE